jgi:very-short-patch-repair endonuclease
VKKELSMQGSNRARALRGVLTDAEQRLWYHLRDRRFGGYKFRRQVAIGSFIADFVCMAERLIVEIDGGQHAERAAEDARRTQYLEAEGYRVVRFWNNEVQENLEGVLQRLSAVIAERPSTLTLPSP